MAWATPLPPQQRLELIERVVKDGVSVTDACRAFGVSRFTFYKWRDRYLKAPPPQQLAALRDQYPTGAHHPNSLNLETQRKILRLVCRHPQYSTHKIASIISGVGNHGVQNFLQKLNLNTFEKRSVFSQTHAPSWSPIWSFSIVLKKLFGQIPAVSQIPPPSFIFSFWRRKLTLLWRPFFISLLSSFLACNLFLVTLNALSRIDSWHSRTGLFLANLALLIGGLFFVYSLKYYFTLALVLSFSRQPAEEGGGYSVGLNGQLNGHLNANGNGRTGWLRRIFGLTGTNNSHSQGSSNNASNHQKLFPQAGGLQPSLDHIKLERKPFVSIHLPFYNEKKVAKRILTACTSMDYYEEGKAQYEVIVCDDSTDETVQIVQHFAKEHNRKNPHGPKVKILHRPTREGFKGAALGYALQNVHPKTEFCVVFDADFVPYPDTLELFIKYHKVNGVFKDTASQSMALDKNSPVCAVTGYQWHVLNKSENWVTRGVRTEYAGSYVIERSGREILGLVKQIHGTVYMIRRDILEKVGWGTSITEDFQLTLKLYEAGYKIIFTPYIQAPAECVSTLRRLIRQRMRWAEGHSNCIKKKWFSLLFGRRVTFSQAQELKASYPHIRFQSQNSRSPKNSQGKVWLASPLTLMEKLEVLYLTPYYLQAFFFLVGTFSWLASETVFRVRLPFWTSLWGWSLVLTNFFSLPLMNSVGLFLEESEEKDYLGILSFILLCYLVVPFQAYASVKGFIRKEEGPWFRTPKTGKITDIFTRGSFYRWISGIFPSPSHRPAPSQASASLPSESPLAWLTNPYVQRNTANNQFNGFKVQSKRRRWLTKLALVVLLVFSVSLYTMARGVPLVLADTVSNYYFWNTTTDEDSVDLSGLVNSGSSMRITTANGSDASERITSTASVYWYSRQLPTGSDNATLPSGNYYFGVYVVGAPGSGKTITWAVDAGFCSGGSGDACGTGASYTSFGPSANIVYDSGTSIGYHQETIGNNAVADTCTSASPCRVFIHLYGISSTKGGNFDFGYNGSAANYISNLETPGVVVPEKLVFFFAAAPLIPMTVLYWRQKPKPDYLKNQSFIKKAISK